MATELSYSRAKRIVRRLGLSVSGGLGFTVCGGQLVNGDQCPKWLARFNGACVYEIAEEWLERRVSDGRNSSNI